LSANQPKPQPPPPLPGWLGRAIDAARKLQVAARTAPVLLRKGGGAWGSIRKTWDVVRREGWTGLKIRAVAAAPPGSRHAAQRLEAPAYQPLISILMPTHGARAPWLDQAIVSVRSQLYASWELCLVEDAAAAPQARRIVEEHAAADPRIRVLHLADGEAAAALAAALADARGDFIVALGPGDALAADALAWVVDAINRNPDANLVYSDEDEIDAVGRAGNPSYKPDWNPDLFLSCNFASRLGALRTGPAREVGGYRTAYDGAQDYDLALRVIGGPDERRIAHIPRVLYHRRRASEAEARSPGAGADDAGRRAIEDHLRRSGIAAEVMPAPDAPGCYRVRYALPEKPPGVTLIIPTRNGGALLETCIESILDRTDYPDLRLLIVDNGSDSPGTLDYLRELSARGRARVLRDDQPFNYSRLNNRAAQLAETPVIGLLNDDVEVVHADWLREMVSHAVRPGVGAVGARLWYPEGTLQHGGIVLGVGGVAGVAHKHLRRGEPGHMHRAVLVQNYSAVTGACLIVQRSIYEEVGGLDEGLAVAFNDVDFCLRLRAKGYRNVWTPYAELIHHESVSRGREDTVEKRRRFLQEIVAMKQRWGDLLLEDPAYNPNLTLDREDFCPARTPQPAQRAAETAGR
jgi:GT2 family glycosyltransferase